MVGQRTLDPLGEVRILEGQPVCNAGSPAGQSQGAPATWLRVRGDVPKWLRGGSAKPLFGGSIPPVASTSPERSRLRGNGLRSPGRPRGALTLRPCRSGGSGIRSGLKLRGPKGHQGSSPCSGTIDRPSTARRRRRVPAPAIGANQAPRRKRRSPMAAAPAAATTNSGMSTATRKARSSGGSGLSMSSVRSGSGRGSRSS